MLRRAVRSNLQTWDALPWVLVLIGLLGMFHHFFKTPESTPADRSTPASFSSDFVSPGRIRGEDHSIPPPSDAVRLMRQRLRDFILPLPGIQSRTVPDALALLQHHWETLPHETDEFPPATFLLEKTAAQALAASDSPALVTLEIPGISLQTNLQLLAAQAGLRVRVVESGVMLEPDTQSSDSIRVGTFELSSIMLKAFNRRSNAIPDMTAEQSPLTRGSNEFTATVPDGSFTVDLDLTPEVIGFEGFINYDTTIQTTGISPLGQNDPVILTDSGIIQPVFASRLFVEKPVQGSLNKLFAAMGIPERSAGPAEVEPASEPDDQSWNSDAELLTVTGPHRTQRIATEIVNAIRESNAPGAKVEFLSAPWENHRPPAEPASRSAKVKDRGNSPGNPAPATGTASPGPLPARVTVRCGESHSVDLPTLTSASFLLLSKPTSQASVTVEKIGPCFQMEVTLHLPGRPDIPVNNTPQATTDHFSVPRYLLRPHQWRLLNFPAPSDDPPSPRQSLFIRVHSATAAQDQ